MPRRNGRGGRNGSTRDFYQRIRRRVLKPEEISGEISKLISEIQEHANLVPYWNIELNLLDVLCTVIEAERHQKEWTKILPSAEYDGLRQISYSLEEIVTMLDNTLRVPLANDTYTGWDRIKWIYKEFKELLEGKQQAEARLEKERQDEERRENAFLTMREKADHIRVAAHQLERPYNSVVEKLTNIVLCFLKHAQFGTLDQQFVIRNLQTAAHLVGGDLVKKERKTV
jgi:hypothetical protein